MTQPENILAQAQVVIGVVVIVALVIALFVATISCAGKADELASCRAGADSLRASIKEWQEARNNTLADLRASTAENRVLANEIAELRRRIAKGHRALDGSDFSDVEDDEEE